VTDGLRIETPTEGKKGERGGRSGLFAETGEKGREEVRLFRPPLHQPREKKE